MLEGYTILEYIESTGSQYIDTGFKPNQDTRVVMDVEQTGSVSSFYFGARTTDVSNTFSAVQLNGTTIRSDYGTKRTTASINTLQRITIDKNKNVLTVGDVVITSPIQTFSAPSNMLLLSTNTNGTVYTPTASAKLYSCQIYDNDILVRDFIPSMDKYGLVGLYDKVEGVFYTSASGTNFSGKWKEPKYLDVSMQEFRHRLFVFTGAIVGTHELPGGYEKADSCYADGNAYLDTGLTVEKTDIVTMEMDILLEGTAAWAGAYYWLEYKSDVSNGVRSILKVESDGTGICNIYDDGNLVRTWDYTSRSYSTVKLGIFKLGNQNNTWTTTSSFPHQVGTLYSCKIWKNGKLVRDFIPCVNVEDGIYYLFDKVEGVIYDSAGTSHFGEKKTVYDFDYTGAVQSVTLKSGTYKLEVWGAQGGVFTSSIVNRGGYSVGTIELSKDTQMFVYVGGQPVASGTEAGDVNLGGFNGGGSAIVSDYNVITYAQGGGGGTDIRIGTDSLYARVIVAGGGAGDSGTDSVAELYGGGKNGGGGNDGYFGGTQNGSGTASTSSTIKGGFGVGANAKPSATNYNYVASGGGGGWYGGCSSTIKSDSNSNYCFRCGGGSGYVYTSDNASNYPSGCLLNSPYYLTDAETIGGNSEMTEPDGSYSTEGHVGSGYARITKL